MRKLNCVRCDVEMKYMMQEKMQLGQTGWILGDWPNLWAGALLLDFYCCPKCGKVELFCAEKQDNEADMLQKQCPRCGSRHDFDYPKCPICKYDYNAKEGGSL